MMKKLIAMMCAVGLAVVLAGCGAQQNQNSDSSASHEESTASQSQTEQTSDESGQGSQDPQYALESEMSQIIATPDQHKGESLRITGKIISKLAAADGKTTWQAYYDPGKSTEPFAFVASDAFNLTTGDFVDVDGVLDATIQGQNGSGQTLTLALIQATDVQVLDAFDGISSEMSLGDPETSIVTPSTVYPEES